MGKISSGMYDARWQRERKAFLRSHKWCVFCLMDKRYTLATVVDHIRPHRGNEQLFRDQSNWQSLCTPHHSSTKQTIERNAHKTPIGLSGFPPDWE